MHVLKTIANGKTIHEVTEKEFEEALRQTSYRMRDWNIVRGDNQSLLFRGPQCFVGELRKNAMFLRGISRECGVSYVGTEPADALRPARTERF